MTNIIDQLIEQKIAKNAFHAAGILNVLHCLDQQNDADRIARCKLYHDWKIAGENKAAARANAIEGKPAPEQLLPEPDMRFCWVCGRDTEDDDGQCSVCQNEYHNFTE